MPTQARAFTNAKAPCLTARMIRATVCPNCQTELEREDHIEVHGKAEWLIIFYWCDDCGWEGKWTRREGLEVLHDPREQRDEMLQRLAW